MIYFCQGKKIEATPLAMYNYFTEKVRKHLHVVLAMSPIGDAFRNRLRMFPSLINCCTIDWFQVRITFWIIGSVEVKLPLPFSPSLPTICSRWIIKINRTNYGSLK